MTGRCWSEQRAQSFQLRAPGWGKGGTLQRGPKPASPAWGGSIECPEISHGNLSISQALPGSSESHTALIESWHCVPPRFCSGQRKRAQNKDISSSPSNKVAQLTIFKDLNESNKNFKCTFIFLLVWHKNNYLTKYTIQISQSHWYIYLSILLSLNGLLAERYRWCDIF